MIKLSINAFKFSLTLLLLLAIFACSSRTVVKSDLGIKGAPDWVNEGHQALKDGEKRYFRGIGSAPPMNDASLQTTTADNRARAEIAQIFTSYMDVVANDYSAAVSDTEKLVNEQAVARTLKNITQLNLAGVQIIAHWKDKNTGTIYSLAELDMNKFETVTAAVKNMDTDLRTHIEQRADNIFDSMTKGN